ncbi:glycoside hydrolase family 16 protein [Ferruginibacter sp.]
MKNQHTKILFVLLSTVLLIAFTNKKKTTTPAAAATPIKDKHWRFEKKPVWQDDFSSGKIDPAKWTFETGGSGWGNNELQYYTDGPNSVVKDGNLVITAKKEKFSTNDYTSSRMVTKGKGDWLYGRFEVRAKLPKGKGTWPAIWMLSSDDSYGGWPASGEIDIMEHVGFDQDNIHSTVHTSAYNHMKGTQKTATKIVTGASDDFHVYRIDWTPYAIRGFIDNSQYFEFVNEGNAFESWPFNKRFHLILNVAVGGNWGGAKGVDSDAFPTSMVVDYVKVYKMIE